MSFPQRLSGVFLASGMTFFFCCFRKKMYPLKTLWSLEENAKEFYLKRKCVNVKYSKDIPKRKRPDSQN
jgi:hypothetical protein